MRAYLHECAEHVDGGVRHAIVLPVERLDDLQPDLLPHAARTQRGECTTELETTTPVSHLMSHIARRYIKIVCGVVVLGETRFINASIYRDNFPAIRIATIFF